MSATSNYQMELVTLLEDLNLDLDAETMLQVKPFFGGAAAYANGRICLSLTQVGLALKLPEVERERLLAAGGQPLRYFAKAPIKRQYVLLPDSLARDPAGLAPLVQLSIQFVLTS